MLYSRGWVEKQFKTEILVDGAKSESPTHQVDCFKNRVALEIEVGGADQRERVLVGDGEHDAPVRVLENVRIWMLEQAFHHDVAAFDQA